MKKGFLKFSIIIFLMLLWVFSDWWQTWKGLPPPFRIEQIKADTVNILPASKHSNDSSPSALSEITADDATCDPDGTAPDSAGDGCYFVDKNQIMYIDTFDVSSIPDNANITGAVLHLEYGAEDGYNGPNYVRYDNGSGLTNTTIKPTDITGWSGDLTYDLYAQGVDTKSELQNVDIEFTNKDGAAPDAIRFDYVWITVTYTLPTLTIQSTGSQVSRMDIPSTNSYVGGAFTMATDFSTVTVSQIVISETGTVNANSNLSNVDIYYETAATCNYDGTETLFGTAASFNASEKATVSGTMTVGTSQVCLYVVLDVGSGASDGETLDIEISSSSDVTISSGTVSGTFPVAISGSTTLQVGNQSPTVDSISILPSPIDLNADSTTTVTITATISDLNGCEDVFVNGSISGVFYDAGAETDSCTADDNDCYPNLTFTEVDDTCTGPGDTSAEAQATVDVWFHANASNQWTAKVTATDSQSQSAFNTQTVTINELAAFKLDVSSINYGTVNPNQVSVEKQVLITTTGNVAVDVQLSGTDLTWSTYSIPVSQQKYSSTSGFNWDSEGTALTNTPTCHELSTTKPTTHPSDQSEYIYWKLKVPLDKPSQTYSGNISFDVVSDSFCP